MESTFFKSQCGTAKNNRFYRQNMIFKNRKWCWQIGHNILKIGCNLQGYNMILEDRAWYLKTGMDTPLGMKAILEALEIFFRTLNFIFDAHFSNYTKLLLKQRNSDKLFSEANVVAEIEDLLCEQKYRRRLPSSDSVQQLIPFSSNHFVPLHLDRKSVV